MVRRTALALIPIVEMAFLALLSGATAQAQEAAAPRCASPSATAVPVSATSMTAADPSRGYICVESVATTGSVQGADALEASKPVGEMDGK